MQPYNLNQIKHVLARTQLRENLRLKLCSIQPLLVQSHGSQKTLITSMYQRKSAHTQTMPSPADMIVRRYESINAHLIY